MNKTLLLNLVSCSVLLTACSPSLLWPFGGSSNDYVEPYACPASIITDYADLFLSSTPVIPATLALVVDGELKYDECQSRPVLTDKPMVYIKRSNASQHEAKIQARYFDRSNLPTNMSLEILDRGNCSSASTTFFKQDNIPLNFQKRSIDPNHADCGTYNKAEAVLTN